MPQPTTPTTPPDKPTSIKNVKFRYLLVRSDGRKFLRDGDITGIAESRRWLVDTLLHGQPIGSQIKELRQITKMGKEIAKQHPFFTEPISLRAAAPHPDDHAFHPGVEPPQSPDQVGEDWGEVFDGESRPKTAGRPVAGKPTNLPDNPHDAEHAEELRLAAEKLASASESQAEAATLRSLGKPAPTLNVDE